MQRNLPDLEGSIAERLDLNDLRIGDGVAAVLEGARRRRPSDWKNSQAGKETETRDAGGIHDSSLIGCPSAQDDPPMFVPRDPWLFFRRKRSLARWFCFSLAVCLVP